MCCISRLLVLAGAVVALTAPASARPFDSKRCVALVGQLPCFDEPAVTDPRERVAGLVELLAQEIADPSDPVSIAFFCSDGTTTSADRRAQLVRYLGTPLGYMGTRGLCPPELVRQACVNARNPELRRHLAIAAAMGGAGDMADAAVATALNDEESGMRAVAVRALAQLNNPQFVPVFVHALSDPHRDVRGTPTIALVGRMGLLKLGLQVSYDKPRYRVAGKDGKLLYVVNDATRQVDEVGLQMAAAPRKPATKAAPAKPAAKTKAAPAKPAPAKGAKVRQPKR